MNIHTFPLKAVCIKLNWTKHWNGSQTHDLRCTFPPGEVEHSPASVTAPLQNNILLQASPLHKFQHQNLVLKAKTFLLLFWPSRFPAVCHICHGLKCKICCLKWFWKLEQKSPGPARLWERFLFFYFVNGVSLENRIQKLSNCEKCPQHSLKLSKNIISTELCQMCHNINTDS